MVGNADAVAVQAEVAVGAARGGVDGIRVSAARLRLHAVEVATVERLVRECERMKTSAATGQGRRRRRLVSCGRTCTRRDRVGGERTRLQRRGRL